MNIFTLLPVHTHSDSYNSQDDENDSQEDEDTSYDDSNQKPGASPPRKDSCTTQVKYNYVNLSCLGDVFLITVWEPVRVTILLCLLFVLITHGVPHSKRACMKRVCTLCRSF